MKKKHVISLSADEVAAVRSMCEELGVTQTAQAVHVGREALARCIAGLRVHQATVVAIRAGLHESGRWQG